MEKFSLHIENTIEHYREQGLMLQGIIAFQYPIYCIHATIKDSTPEKDYQIDLTLLKILEAIPEIDINSIHNLTNIPKQAIETRIKILIKEEFLNGNFKNIILTEAGRNYIKNGNTVRFQFRSYDFFVDGRTLNPLTKGFYGKWRRFLINDTQFHTRRNKEGKIFEEKDFKPDLVFTPLDKKKLVSNIMAITPERREEYAIPLGCVNIEKIDYSQLCFPLMVGLFLNHKGEVVKKLMNGYTSPGNDEDIIDLSENLEKAISDSVIQFERNTVHNVVFAKHNMDSLKSIPDSVDKIYSASKTDIIDFIKTKARISIDYEENLTCTDKTLIFEVDEMVIKNNPGKRRELIQNLIRERDYMLSQYTLNGVWLVNILYNTNDQFVQELITLYQELEHAREQGELGMTIEKYMDKNPDLEKLVLLQEYDIVEKININKHMILFEQDV